jgi:hypothetical protein
MSTGKIDVWITTEGDPCHVRELGVDYPEPWVVAIWDCCGRVLTWCGRRYFGLQTKCGHLEIEVPPGCYVLRAAEAMWWDTNGVRGNYWTDHAVVQVSCGQEVCVTLVAPSTHNCGWGWLHVLEGLRGVQAVPGDLLDAAIRANRAVVERLPRSDFEYATEESMLQLVREAEKIRPPNRPPSEPRDAESPPQES